MGLKISKTQQAKDAQGFSTDSRKCSNCANFKSVMVEIPADRYQGTHMEEKNKRCGIGGFAVGSGSSCNLYSPKV